ncbi:MAG: DUF896 domain-containing protein [Acholeplasmataceae bacterium]
MKIKGIHHISNLVNHPQENIEFYTSLMGLRLIKKAVNFDDASTYHFYYGNNNADIGTVITSFPIGENTKDGVKGGGQIVSTYYNIPKGSFDFWLERIKSFDLNVSIINRFNKKHLVFSDYLGITNELVEEDSNRVNIYSFNGIHKNNAILGFNGALAHSKSPEETLDFFINILGASVSLEDDNYYRLNLNSNFAGILDLSKKSFKKGNLSKGTVHHIAFSVDSLEDLLKFKEKIEKLNIFVTKVRERQFFKAIYFKEPGGMIIELSTMKPGFNSSEIDDQGTKLFLPNHFLDKRELIESKLIPVYVKPVSKLKRHHYLDHDGYLKELRFHEVLTRINELSKLSKERSLTDDEIIEQKSLRKEYLNTFKNNFKNHLENIEIEDITWN